MLEQIQNITNLPQEYQIFNIIILSIMIISVFYLLIEILLLPLKQL